MFLVKTIYKKYDKIKVKKYTNGNYKKVSVKAVNPWYIFYFYK